MNPLTTRFGRAAVSIAWRQLHVMFTKPSLFLPSLIFPLFFFAAFAGGLSAVGYAPNFDYPSYTTFQYVFVLMQSAIFGGVFTGFAIAADFEFGFARRMLLATRNRSALIAGYSLTALVRALLVWAVVTVVAVATGAQISGSGRRPARDPGDRGDAQLRRHPVRLRASRCASAPCRRRR